MLVVFRPTEGMEFMSMDELEWLECSTTTFRRDSATAITARYKGNGCFEFSGAKDTVCTSTHVDLQQVCAAWNGCRATVIRSSCLASEEEP
jgi:hypothetical protein